MNSLKWKILKHNGVAFPKEHEYQGLELIIKGKKVKLTVHGEEMALAWSMKIGTPYVEDEVFASNFLSDFKKELPKEYSKITIQDLDFSEFVGWRERQKEWKAIPENKKQLAAERKKIRLEMKDKFGYAEVDGKKTEIANYMVEPPGLFMGRGKHPFRGHWKPRVFPKDVTLNLSKEAKKPPGKWGNIIHDQDSMWLASWTDKLTCKRKYVWLHDSCSLRQSRDKAKYDTAMKLERHLPRVQKLIREGMNSKDEKIRKLATVSYLIDKLCMRVGDEKDDDEADTVGASTLRVEHVTIDKKQIKFNFLGKDSVQWEKYLEISDGVSRLFKDNLESFIRGKKSNDLLFNDIKSYHVNRFLSTSMNGLTAKNFRTFHATNIVRSYISKHDSFKEECPEQEKIFHAKMANLEAAVTCNHKRTPPKTWENTLQKKKDSLTKIKKINPKTEKAKIKLKERLLKAELAIKLHRETKEYNLNTSLRNYIDPRLYSSWAKHIGLNWEKIYPKTLQKKFAWTKRSKMKWKSWKTSPSSKK